MNGRAMLPAYIFSKHRRQQVSRLGQPQPTVMYATARGRLFRVAQKFADERPFDWGDGGADPAPTVYTAECMLMDYFGRWPNARGPAGDCTPGIDSLYELNGSAVVSGAIGAVEPFDSDDISWTLATCIASSFAARVLTHAPDEFRVELPLIATVLCDIERAVGVPLP